MPLLDKKIAIVTGCAQGSGHKIATTLHEHGATVIATDINATQLKESFAELTDARLQTATLDITQEESWQTVVDDCIAQFGNVDILVNNAAILHLGNLAHTSSDDLLRLFNVNVAGAHRGIRAVVPHMKKAGRGSIVNIGSVDSLEGLNGVSAYCASKWGIRGLSKALALELGRDGIRVNLVCPSSGNPAMFGPWGESISKCIDETEQYIVNRAIPRGGEPQEVANAVVFFASELSTYCTGADLAVDGGLSAGNFIPGFNNI